MQTLLGSSKRGGSSNSRSSSRCACMLNSFLPPRIWTMLKILTKKLRNQSLNEIQPFQLKISYPPSDEEDSDDSEGENQELAQIDRERRRNCTLTPLATNQLQNQENQCCKVRAHFPTGLDRHSSEEELECISRECAAEKRKWSQVNRLTCCGDNYNTSSSDEEVKNLCGMSFRPVVEAAEGFHASSSPVLFSASPPKRLQPLVRTPTSRPLIFTSVGASFEQVMPCKRHRQGYGDKVSRPSLDLEKMQQKMLFKKNCGAKTRVIKIRHIGGSRPPSHFVYDPSTFAFRSLSTLKPLSPVAPVEEPSCACWRRYSGIIIPIDCPVGIVGGRACIGNNHQDPWSHETGDFSLMSVCFSSHHRLRRLTERECTCIEQVRLWSLCAIMEMVSHAQKAVFSWKLAYCPKEWAATHVLESEK